MRDKARVPERRKPVSLRRGRSWEFAALLLRGHWCFSRPGLQDPQLVRGKRARRKGSRGNRQAGLIPSPPGATPRLSSLWMPELRLPFLTWTLEYAQRSRSWKRPRVLEKTCVWSKPSCLRQQPERQRLPQNGLRNPGL
ncbi:rCG50625, isoform CRA_a [Rattus norvegicus]|uniref:RCG50625, isoform CRA_a n=1 Tax=Rattus norvegicus TaxID=10116 RepID=A6KCN7_RAT|nr:rCG50625, isoform CRA_a [Rattus norvegicus]